jgi:hypothetical protein
VAEFQQRKSQTEPNTAIVVGKQGEHRRSVSANPTTTLNSASGSGSVHPLAHRRSNSVAPPLPLTPAPTIIPSTNSLTVPPANATDAPGMLGSVASWFGFRRSPNPSQPSSRSQTPSSSPPNNPVISFKHHSNTILTPF